MPQLPPELRVEIRKTGDLFSAVTQRANRKEICANTFQYDPKKLVHLEPRWMLDKGASTPHQVLRQEGVPAEPRPADDKRLVDYGQRLYNYLFGDGAKLQNFLEFNDAYRRQARLTLALHPSAAALWRLPWEYLHDKTDFLCLSGRFLLNRAPAGMGQLEPPETPRPLRILVVIAGPDDQPELNFEQELAVMQEALDEAQRQGWVQVDYLDDATLEALRERLGREEYHVLHYTGHGAYSETEEKGQLCFEDETGRADLVSADALRPLLINQPSLRLAILSACQSAQTGGLEAFDSVATGLLAADLPAVLAMQSSILDQSAIEMARVFYTQLARGQTPEQALFQARYAMDQLDQRRPAKNQERRFDWGVPALYLRAPGMRLINPEVEAQLIAPPPLRDLGGLPLPRIFVGRRPELRQLRRALRQRGNTLLVRGMGGVGKSALAAKLLDRPGAEAELDDTLVIRCHELSLPADALTKLANFWQGQGLAGHAEAAALLLDSRQDPAERARLAQQRVDSRRYLVVFDNLETWLEDSSPPQSLPVGGKAALAAGGAITDETLRPLLHGLLTARSNTTFLFTSRHRWAEFDALPAQNRLEIHLGGLDMRQAVRLMNTLPRLKDEPLKDKLGAWKRVGGHPKTIELLDGWLVAGRSLRALLDDPTLKKLLVQEWESYFLDDLLARLTAPEREALTALSILEEPFWSQTVRDLVGARARHPAGPLLAPQEAQPDASPLQRWLDLSLIQFHRTDADGDPWYTIHTVVRDYLLGRLDEGQIRDLHWRAAAYYGAPFVEEARRHFAQRGVDANGERIGRLARGRRGVVGAWVSQTQDMDRARWAVEQALNWGGHLFQAGRADPAGEIVNAVHDVLARWGQRDRAKSLLRRSIATLEGPSRAAAQGNLATLLQGEGRLAEALATHQEVYQTFAALEAKQQMAGALGQMGSVYQDMGEYDQAIEKYEAALRIVHETGNEEVQAICLHQLSMLYMLKEDYLAALAQGQAAEEIDRKRGDLAGLAADLHQQGLIFTDLGRPAEAFERFSQSLGIKRRIGDQSGAAGSLAELGKLLMKAGRMAEAITAFNQALEIDRRQENPKMGISLSMLGEIHERQGEYPAALEKYQQAKLIFQQAIPANLPTIERHIARVRGKMGPG